MTEKQFTLIDMNNIEKELLSPIKDNGSDCLTWFEVVECLNALHEENEQLKQVAEEFIENKTQHNLWKLRTILKELKGDGE